MNKSEVVLSAPPIAVAGASFFGYSLPEWAAIITIVYTLLLIGKLCWPTIRDAIRGFKP